MVKRVLTVVTNVAHFGDPSRPTGLWLSEFTHAWNVFDGHDFQQEIVSPAGGRVPLEPRSLRFPNYAWNARSWRRDPVRMRMLADTLRPDEVDSADFHAIYFAGGHAAMYDFPHSEGLQRLTREIFERGGVVGSVCHGSCGLLNTRLSDGSHLVAGRRVTGVAWQEEILTRRHKVVPFNAEAEMKKRGARYTKAVLPFVSFPVVDGKLVTGQNPWSARETAEKVSALL